MTSTTAHSERNEAPAASKAESILAAAKRTFLESGFGAVSMDTIAREAGVSKATVYAHFAGKEELFGAVIGANASAILPGFSAGELDPGDVRASLTTLGRRFLELLLSPDAIALHRIILGEVSRFPAARRGVLACRARAQPGSRSKPSCAAPPLPERCRSADTRLAAEQFVGLVRGEIQLRHLLRLEAATRDEPSIRDVVAAAVDTFMRAFGRRDDGR